MVEEGTIQRLRDEGKFEAIEKEILEFMDVTVTDCRELLDAGDREAFCELLDMTLELGSFEEVRKIIEKDNN